MPERDIVSRYALLRDRCDIRRQHRARVPSETPRIRKPPSLRRDNASGAASKPNWSSPLIVS